MNNRIHELAGEIISSLNSSEREERIINLLTSEFHKNKGGFEDIKDAYSHLCYNWSVHEKKMNKTDYMYYKSFVGLSKLHLEANPVRMKLMLKKAGYTLKWQAPE